MQGDERETKAAAAEVKAAFVASSASVTVTTSTDVTPPASTIPRVPVRRVAAYAISIFLQ